MSKVMDRVVMPGTVKINGADRSIFCHIVIRNGVLHIVGVVGPLSNGNCAGPSGQIAKWLAEHGTDIVFAQGWDDAEVFERFLKIWNHWHLNNTRPGCDHQSSWNKDMVEVVTYTASVAAFEIRERARAKAERAALDGRVADLTVVEQHMLRSDWREPRYDPPGADDPLAYLYTESRREIRPASQVYPHQHPDGLLGKPCEVCGYPFGTAWLFSTLPAEVVAFLDLLPGARRTPGGGWFREGGDS